MYKRQFAYSSDIRYNTRREVIVVDEPGVDEARESYSYPETTAPVDLGYTVNVPADRTPADPVPAIPTPAELSVLP